MEKFYHNKRYNLFLGVFDLEEEAAEAYNKAYIKFKTARLLPSGEYSASVSKESKAKKPIDEVVKKESAKNRMLKSRYGLTKDEYNKMYDDQCKKCDICEKELELGGKKGLHVDHCHTTGKVRGLLCPSCNSALGKFKDDISILSKAIDYIKNSEHEK